MVRYLCFIALAFFLMISNRSFAQDIFRGENLRNIKVDQLTDNDILKFQQQLKAMGITQQQAEQIAISRGMPLSEIQKLRQRISQINSNAPQSNVPATQGNPQNLNQLKTGIDTTKKALIDTSQLLQQFKPLIDPRIFGSELFNNATLNFEPNLKIATPMNYELGPDDEIDISVYGVQEVSDILDVTPE